MQSSGQLGRARSTMSKSNENFMDEQFGARQNGSSESGSSYDSSSSDDHNRNQSKKRVTKSRIGLETPMGQRELEPDAFRGAMNPDDWYILICKEHKIVVWTVTSVLSSR